MKKLLPLLAILALSTGAIAQDNTAKLALAREAISAMQADKMLDGMSGQIKQMAMSQAQLPAETTPEQKARFEAFMTKVTDLAMGEAKAMIAKMDPIYAEVYTEAELKAIIAFFKSPEGHSMMAKQPQIMAQIMPLVQGMQQSMMPKMQQLIEEFKAQQDTAPAPAK